jgi:hypothetical protein
VNTFVFINTEILSNMKAIYQLVVFLSAFAVINGCINQEKKNPESARYCESAFEESWESLAKTTVAPDWFLDAKFGIYTHWGPASNAFVNMDKPESEIQIHTLSTLIGALNLPIKKIELLESDESLKWKRNEKGLIIQSPENYPTDYSHCFKITLEGYSELDIGGEDG